MLRKWVLFGLGMMFPLTASAVTELTPRAGYEAAADLLLQVPMRVDGRSPVPLILRMLQQEDMDSLSLLADREHPELLARFRYSDDLLPELSTRLAVLRDTRILAVISRPDHIFSVKRDVHVDAGAKDKGVAGKSEPGAVLANPPQLEIKRVGDEIRIIVTTNESLLDDDSPDISRPYVKYFKITSNNQSLVEAELSPFVWFKPFFQFSLRNDEFVGELTLEWKANNGQLGTTSAVIGPLDQAAVTDVESE